MAKPNLHLIPAESRPSGLSEDVEFLGETCAEFWTENRGQPSGVEIRKSPSGANYVFKLGRGALHKRVLRGLIAAPSRSRRAFEIGRHLELAGVPTPRALAYAEQRIGPFACRDALVMEYIKAPTLRERIAADRMGAAWIRSAAVSIRAMHACGVRHRDLKASNLLAPDCTPGGHRALLLDLDGARLLGQTPSFQVRVRDLARLALSLQTLEAESQLENFYGELEGWSSDQLREASLRIAAYSDSKTRRNLRRGRPLS